MRANVESFVLLVPSKECIDDIGQQPPRREGSGSALSEVKYK
jgi:hypothetical protein